MAGHRSSRNGHHVDVPDSFAPLSPRGNARAAIWNAVRDIGAPHVTGIIAQLYEVGPKLASAQVEDSLEDGAFQDRGRRTLS